MTETVLDRDMQTKLIDALDRKAAAGMALFLKQDGMQETYSYGEISDLMFLVAVFLMRSSIELDIGLKELLDMQNFYLDNLKGQNQGKNGFMIL